MGVSAIESNKQIEPSSI